MAFALVVEGLDVMSREQVAARLESLGHAIRAEADPAYKRSTWGLRPEDVAELHALTGESERWVR